MNLTHLVQALLSNCILYGRLCSIQLIHCFVMRLWQHHTIVIFQLYKKKKIDDGDTFPACQIIYSTCHLQSVGGHAWILTVITWHEDGGKHEPDSCPDVSSGYCSFSFFALRDRRTQGKMKRTTRHLQLSVLWPHVRRVTGKAMTILTRNDDSQMNV